MLLPLSQDEAAGASARAEAGGASSFAGRAGRAKARGKGRSASAAVFRTCSALPEYLARVVDYRQMDLDATFYQMVTLCVQPSKVYKSAYYRKQTKNRWARDDPGFAAIQFLFLLVATVAWAVAFRAASLSSFVSLLFHAFVVEWLAFGLAISTLCWWIANHHFRMRSSNQSMGDTFFVEQRVEWQYAFDIHCNSFFVLFLFLYVLQFLLAPALASDSFAALLLGNLLYSLGWGFYTYITFLGYMALPFLHRTERFLLPLVLIVGTFVTTLLLKAIAGVQINFAHMSVNYYYS